MSDDVIPNEVVENHEEPDDDVDREHPEKAAAEGRVGQRKEHDPEGENDENLETSDHSDAPGPFGTG